MLLNKIWEVVDKEFGFSEPSFINRKNRIIFVKELLSQVFGEILYLNNNVAEFFIFDKIKNVICQAPIHEVWDIIEFICHQLVQIIAYKYGKKEVEKFFIYINSIFKIECIGYRFVNGKIIKNIDDIEISAIEEASTTDFDGCNKHIQKATDYLYDRENPDYKNSIKESISAVESICCVIVKDKNATLGKALTLLEEKQQLNGQLKAAFEKLYAYTNKAGGIRHANPLVASDVSFEEAKFMLISCCAFVNFLIEKYSML